VSTAIERLIVPSDGDLPSFTGWKLYDIEARPEENDLVCACDSRIRTYEQEHSLVMTVRFCCTQCGGSGKVQLRRLFPYRYESAQFGTCSRCLGEGYALLLCAGGNKGQPWKILEVDNALSSRQVQS
jgi:DnaJ-class molecular chaperone